MPWQVLENVDTEIISIHAALLPTSAEGDILCFGDWTNHGELTHARIFHVGAESIDSFSNADLPNTNAFCGGQAFLADGRLLVGGGTVGWPSHEGLHGAHYDGERACWIYLPNELRWVRVKDFNFQPGSNSKGGGRWYPTLVTLGNGEVFAAAGHPDTSDDYNGRHNNNTPERYSPSANWWSLMATDITAPNGVNSDSYPRFHLLPSGLLFTDTAGDEGTKRIFDPFTGEWTGDDVDVSDLPGFYSRGSSATSVLLPLQPPAYRPRVLATNSPNNTAYRIDLDSSPSWTATAAREGSAAGLERTHGCAVLLPTGHVLACGGVIPSGMENVPATPVLQPELYTPGINWSTGEFTGEESWETVEEFAEVGRGYHSVALLLPDGRVWTAGSTEGFGEAEKRIEFFSPWYVGQSRPAIESAPPAITYARQFTVTVANGNQIDRVALMRCGSVTHAFDSDQRYIGLQFTQEGTSLVITGPPNTNIAPPGQYMLWVVDENGRPCQLAKFVRLSPQNVYLVTDRSTFSVHEVNASGLPSYFKNAFYFVMDGFLPKELGEPAEPPEISFLYPNGDPVPGMHFELTDTKWEDPSTPPDIAQRATFTFNIYFDSMEAFDDISGDSDDVTLRAVHGAHSATAPLVLSKNPNPWMRDGETPYLSLDVRVFQI